MYNNKIAANGLKYFAIVLSVTFLWSCSGGGNNDSSLEIDPVGPEVPIDPDFPEYALVALEPGDDLETRTLSALITAEPNTIVQLPAGTYDFTGELSSSVDNIVLRGTGMGAESGTVLRFDGQTTGAQSLIATGDNFVV